MLLGQLARLPDVDIIPINPVRDRPVHYLDHQLPEELETEDMGERELRGKVEAFRLYSVRPRE